MTAKRKTLKQIREDHEVETERAFQKGREHQKLIQDHQPDPVQEILNKREKHYGVYKEHTRITQHLKDDMCDSPNWNILTSDQKETLEMVAHKIGRILNGDPNFIDSWDDIMGYVKLTTNIIKERS